jgi:two-component system chemotaxis response regulator CheY
MRILLIDDSATTRNIIKNVLGQTWKRCEFIEAGDGIEGLSCLAEGGGHLDLVMVDWNMPNMDGLAFVKRVRETNKSLPIVMVTTEAERNRVVEAVKTGISGYLIKPFTPETLTEKVRNLLAKAKVVAA